MRAAFKLSKWYLDCITDLGDASIVCTGTVDWGPICLHCSSLLENTARLVTARHSLWPQAAPNIDSGSLRWRSGALRIDSEWHAGSSEICETVFASDAGSIEWRCLMPRAETRINDRSGLGYAEHLTITIAPWKLPIRVLRWGRFATPSDWVVWIDWAGDFTRRIVYRNGETASASRIDDGLIEFQDGARLVMDRSLVLRQGRLGAQALSVIPGVRDTFPARLLKVNECKWRSRASFDRLGRPPVEGWAIHERVEWPK